MELYIVRHGIAEARSTDKPDDTRGLTRDGRSKTRQAALGLRAVKCRPGRITTSPLRRAAETAEIMADVLGPALPVEACECLRPGSPVSDLLAWLGGLEDDFVMVVGHMPDVAELASALVSKGRPIEVSFRKAAVCCVSFEGRPEPGAGCLEWLIQPRQLRAMGAGKEGGAGRGKRK